MNAIAVHSLGIGLATHNAQQQVIEVYYPQPLLSPDPALSSVLMQSCAISPDENSALELDADTATMLATGLS